MNIAFFCIPAHGHTNPTLAVVRELTARGHTVRYYTTEAFRAKVEAAGAVFVPFDTEAARPGMTAADGARLGSDLAFSTKLIVDLTLAADDWLSRELTAHRPDVIAGDSMAFWAKLAAKKHGIPFVSSTTTFAFNRFSAKVIEQNGAGFLQFLLAQPRINRQLKRLRAAGYAVKSVFDIIANDNETETVVYTSPDFQPCADTFSENTTSSVPSCAPHSRPLKSCRGAPSSTSRSARSTTTRSPSTVPALPPSAAIRAFSSCSPPARRQTSRRSVPFRKTAPSARAWTRWRCSTAPTSFSPTAA